MNRNGKPTNNGQRKAVASSAQPIPKEEATLITRARNAGFKGQSLIAEVARRLAQVTLQRRPPGSGTGNRVSVAKARTSIDPKRLAEHSGILARQIHKFFPFHTQTVPPIDYDEGANQDIDAMVPFEMCTAETLTVSSGNTALIFMDPSEGRLGGVVQFATSSMNTSFFDKTASASWPFDGATNIVLQPTYMLTNPPNVRAAFGSFSTITWPDAAANVIGGVGAQPYTWLGGGVAIEVFANYLGNVEISHCGPSDSPHIYGCSRPDISRELYNPGIHDNAFTNVGTGVANLLATALPAYNTNIAELARAGVHPCYSPPNSMPTVDDFTPKRVQQLGRLDMLQGGSQHAHKVYAWTFHTESSQLSSFDHSTLLSNWRFPNRQGNHAPSANPTDFLRSGQGFIMVTATGADAKVIIKGRCTFAGVPTGPARVHAQRKDVQLFNNEDRDDCDEHTSSPDAHPSVVASTIEEALAGAGTAGLLKSGLASPIAKQIAEKITSIPIVGTAAKTAILSAESGFSWLTSHLGSIAKSVLPKVAVAAEDVAEALPFML